MKKRLLFYALVCVFSSLTAHAQQPVEGSTYYLPKTVIRVALLVQKDTYHPGELAEYAERYLQEIVNQEENTFYSIANIQLNSYGVPDPAKQFTAKMDNKHSINKLYKDDNGVLIGVNSQGRKQAALETFTPAPKAKALNPRDYMSQEILSAGSKEKMAELCAREIYDIRESRNQLTRGEADFMPKDGEQLKTMLQQLETQEKALRQLFEGTTTSDTTEHIITYIPEKEVNKEVLFRFSNKLGMVDADDLSGNPYYITIKALQTVQTSNIDIENNKKVKDDVGINTNRPGKIRVSLHAGQKRCGEVEMYAAQFGEVEPLSGELFGKKVTTHVILNPVTGNAETIQTELLKK